MTAFRWALIVAAGLAVATAAAQAQNGPSFNVIINPQPQEVVPRRVPPREDYRRYRDRDRYESAYRRDRDRHDHRDARRGPPPHASAHGYRRDPVVQQQIAPGLYIVTPGD